MSMKPITVSINPTYFCNFSCDFCYLTEEQLNDTKKIDLDVLDHLLEQIPEIGYVDLYGGEIGALKKDYFYDLKRTIRKHYDGEINIITNFSMLHEGFFEEDVHLSVSYDFTAREKHDRVFSNILMSPVPISVLILASRRVLETDVDHMIQMLNAASSVISVEIKPYSTNQSNEHDVTDMEFEYLVGQWLERTDKMRFQFINEERIAQSLANEYNAFSDDHIYITPNGKFAVLEFDLNNREYFLELDTWAQYLDWAQKEKLQLSPICMACEFCGHCLTEHYRPVYDLENSCNGYRNLLLWYDGRLESLPRNVSSAE